MRMHPTALIDLLPQNLVHRFSFGELINQFVQIAYLLHQRILDFFHAHTAHHAFDQRAVRMMAGAWAKKVSRSFPCSICRL